MLVLSASWAGNSVAHADPRPKMTLHINKRSEGRETVLRLSGRIESQYLQEFRSEIEGSPNRVVLDLEEVKLVDLEVVRFLGVCEEDGIELRHCPHYIREWIVRERAAGARDW